MKIVTALFVAPYYYAAVAPLPAAAERGVSNFKINDERVLRQHKNKKNDDDVEETISPEETGADAEDAAELELFSPDPEETGADAAETVVVSTEAEEYIDNDYASGQGSSKSSKSAPPSAAPADGTYSCRKDFYVMGSNSEMTTTVSDNGLTIKNFAPLYGYGLDGRPDYSKYIGQYSSVDILIPVGESGAYTCQQTSFIGTNYVNGWFVDQVTASGICFSAGPGNAWEGNGGVSGGLGTYEGATGSMNWQCFANCTIALDVCVFLDAVQQN